MKDLAITIILAVIMVLNLMDVITDIGLGVPRPHILEEAAIVLISAVACCYLIFDIRSRTREMHTLSANLARSDAALASLNSEMARARHAYSEVIQRQFLDWGLTSSEQQVALLLLKGLSFREIATVRDTREKTVRQQASTIYSKSGLEGRHAFSAWFLEDFLGAAGPPEAGPRQAGPPEAGPAAAGMPAAGTPAAGTPAAGTPAACMPAAGKPTDSRPPAADPVNAEREPRPR
jgi:DNA-binding CsgD family transcriptional regulator